MYWYEQEDTIRKKFYGVFEGGGAKGVAYAGALKALQAEGCWFQATAGASAGAITAALIAAGLSPGEIEAATVEVLKLLTTGPWSGIWRLRAGHGYFPSRPFRRWLDQKFRSQIARKTKQMPKSGVTFEALFEATGIELNVVTADISARTHMIFSCHETPKCIVADAVVASSSIPYAFANHILQVPVEGAEERVLHHTIVDGGVWANFPLYIFADKAFREFYTREPVVIPSEEILGFVLGGDHVLTPPKSNRLQFVHGLKSSELKAKEWENTHKKVPGKDRGFWRTIVSRIVSGIVSGILYPFYLLGRLLQWYSGADRGRWPAPRLRPIRYLVRAVSGLAGGLRPLLSGAIVIVAFALGAKEVWLFFVNPLQQQPPTGLFLVVDVVLIILITVLFPLVLFGAVLAVTANAVLLRVSKQVISGLVGTYMTGSGAPPWVVRAKNVIVLPIPNEVKTLSFRMGEPEIVKLVQGAEEATRVWIKSLLEQPGTGESRQARRCCEVRGIEADGDGKNGAGPAEHA